MKVNFEYWYDEGYILTIIDKALWERIMFYYNEYAVSLDNRPRILNRIKYNEEMLLLLEKRGNFKIYKYLKQKNLININTK